MVAGIRTRGANPTELNELEGVGNLVESYDEII
jgi:hypothetical protein